MGRPEGVRINLESHSLAQGVMAQDGAVTCFILEIHLYEPLKVLVWAAREGSHQLYITIRSVCSLRRTAPRD